MKRPILIALIGYIIGIIWELYLNKLSIAFIFIIIIPITLILKSNSNNYNKEKIKIFVIIIIFILISKFTTQNLRIKYEKLYSSLEEGEFIATIVNNGQEKKYKTVYKIKIESINKEEKYKNTFLLLYIDNAFEKLNYGDKIYFTGKYSKANSATNYKAFDYSEYLKSLKLYGTVVAEKSTIKIIKNKNLNSLGVLINKLKVNLNANIDEIIKNENKELLKGILLGDTEEIDDDIKESFRISNMYHLLAVSGTHVSFVVLGMVSVLKKINLNKKISNIFCSIILILYMFLMGFTPSVTRACIMTIISILSFLFYRKSDVLNNIAISLFIILVDNPYIIRSLSLLLSYSGTIGIIFFYNIVYEYLKFIHLEKVRTIISVSISAQIAIMPIVVFNFNTFSLTFFISSLLYSFVIGIILILGYILLILSFINIFISSKIAILLNFFLNILIIISKYSAKIPLSKIYLPTPSMLVIVIYYISIFLYAYLYKIKGKQEINNIIFKYLLKTIVIVLIITFVVSIFFNIFPKGLKIYFIDVGQGDSTLIIGEKGAKILIDGGGSATYDVGKNILLTYLLDRQITRLDYVIISHFDNDHVGGLLTIMEELKVKNVIIAKQPEDSENYQKFKQIVKKKKINVIIVGGRRPRRPFKNASRKKFIF